MGVELAQQDSAGLTQSARRSAISSGDIIGMKFTATGGAYSGGFIEILQGYWNTLQHAQGLPASMSSVARLASSTARSAVTVM